MTLTIDVYSQPNCQPCRGTVRLLDKLGLTYTYIDITEDEAAAEHCRSLGHQQTPVVQICGGRSWSGYRPDLIKELTKGAPTA